MFKYNYDGVPSISVKPKSNEIVLNEITAVESLIDANSYYMEVIDTKSIISSTLVDIDIMIKGTEATEDKGPWYKRLWEAIKIAFKALWGYITSFWKWIWGKFKAGKDKIKNSIIAFCVKRVWLMKALKWLKDKFPGKKAKDTTEKEVEEAIDATEIEIQEELKKARANKFSGFESIIGIESIWESITGFFKSIKNWVMDKIMWFVRNCLVSEEMQEMMEKGVKKTTEESKNTVASFCYINKEKLPIFIERTTELKDWLLTLTSESENVGIKFLNLLGATTAIYILFLSGDTAGKLAYRESIDTTEAKRLMGICKQQLDKELEGNIKIATTAKNNPNVFRLEAYFNEFKFNNLFPTLEAISELSEIISKNTTNANIFKEIESTDESEEIINSRLKNFCEEDDNKNRLSLLSELISLNNYATKRLAKLVTEITNKMNTIVNSTKED